MLRILASLLSLVLLNVSPTKHVGSPELDSILTGVKKTCADESLQESCISLRIIFHNFGLSLANQYMEHKGGRRAQSRSLVKRTAENIQRETEMIQVTSETDDAISVISACDQNTDLRSASPFCLTVRESAEKVLIQAMSVLKVARKILLPRNSLIIGVAVMDLIYRVLYCETDSHANMGKQLSNLAGKVLRDTCVISIAWHYFTLCVISVVYVIDRACGILGEPGESSTNHPTNS